MSKGKKKEPTPKLDDKGYRVSISPALMGSLGRMRKDPFDDILESEGIMKAREYQEGRVDEMNLKREIKMAKLRKEIDKLEKETEKVDSGDSDMPRISVAMAQQIANLPPGEREKVIQTYALFSSIDRSKGRGDSLLPLLIGFSKTNPGTPQTNMLDYAKVITDSFKTGLDVMKSAQVQEKPSNAVEFMKVMKDLVISGVRDPLIVAMKELQPQPSAFEQILVNPEMRSAAKEMGMFGSSEPRSGSTDTDLKIAEITTANTLEITKMNLDMKKSMLEMNAKERSEDRRTEAILTALSPLTAILSGPAAQRMRQFGQQQAAAHEPPGGMPPLENQIRIQCSCGHLGPITFEGPPPDHVNCPSCGLELNVGDAPDVSGNP